ncbi:hypothetical protein ASF66_13380 [Pseudomonas sp. Leaf129]|uniref:hypothetical protein n=1 Tax=Pseudomonas sp. Leaf129 TaxID=1736268 RepID=UPI000703A8D0|nr:hypothetical protein [Pseudomonas sp. Leaf129]KQQ60731.1 hypothetical protein ASF66_13380 [Pseudomonas sp. Leaf129]
MKNRSHDEAMAKVFRADPTYAIELHAEVCCEGCTGELAVLTRRLSTAVAMVKMVHNDTDHKN